ncbi:MAG TPA: quinolinate synthase NadA [Chryseolinea sp.]|nr:quinolinate synthase NadA [Chryseolinea sp.]
MHENRKIKKGQDITSLAHYYQRPEIQELADSLDESPGLSKQILTENYRKSISTELLAFRNILLSD